MSLTKKIADALRAGVAISDREIDRFLPEELQRASARFWTPVEVTLRIAGWLDEERVDTLCDIGAGCGKFAVVTMLSSEVRVIGLERRAHLVEIARELAHAFDVDAAFVLGDLSEIPSARAYYLYNPFAEHDYAAEERLDNTVPHSHEQALDDVQRIEQFLEAAPIDTRAVIYNGFGGRIPPSYAQTHVDRYLPNILRMFRKVR